MRISRRALLAPLGLCVSAAALAWLGPRHLPVLHQSAAWLEDFQLAYFSAPRPQNENIVILAVTEETLASMPFRSPLDRGFLAGVLRTLAEREARVVGIDVIFDQPTVAADDEALLEAIDAFPGPVVVAVGDAASGLTERQLDFQWSYLAGRTVGLAKVTTTAGVVRYVQPGDAIDGHFKPSFPAALAVAFGARPPAAPQRLHYRAQAQGGLPAIRIYPAHSAPHLPASWLQGKVVLIGADVPHQDRFRTPLSILGGPYSTMAGVEVHAQALAQILDGDAYPDLAEWAQASIVIAAALLGVALPFSHLRLPAKSLLVASAVSGYWGTSFLYLASGSVLLPLLSPTLALLLGLAFATAHARREDRAERRFLHQAFQRYVSPSVIDQLLADRGKLVLGGERREMSFLFSDLAGFTALVEQHEPEAVVSLLQDYFEGMLRIAMAHGGTVDRLVGDGIAVFFGAPARQPDHAARCVRCALAFDTYCEAFRAEQASQGMQVGITRIGVHTGTAIVGNVGSTMRFHYTAHGDCVNSAARLEAANKHFGTRVCISAQAARHFPEGKFRPVARLVPKGKAQYLDCVTPADGVSEEILGGYCRAYAALARNDPNSLALFEALHRQAASDGLIAFHWRRLRRGETGITVALEEK